MATVFSEVYQTPEWFHSIIFSNIICTTPENEEIILVKFLITFIAVLANMPEHVLGFTKP
jgi:hypothetical protein